MPVTPFDPPYNGTVVPGFGTTQTHLPNVYVTPVNDTITIPELTPLPAISGNDVLAVDTGLTTYKIQLSQLAAYINSLPINESSIVGYMVTTIQGYPANGTLVIPIGSFSGILLATNGLSYIVPLNPLYTPPTQGLAFAYVNSITDVYPSTGMLVIANDAVSGTSGLLIGDNGYSYIITFDNSIFTSIATSVTKVTASNIYPVSGVLLSKQNAQTGNAQILFGDDGNIYTLMTQPLGFLARIVNGNFDPSQNIQYCNTAQTVSISNMFTGFQNSIYANGSSVLITFTNGTLIGFNSDGSSTTQLITNGQILTFERISGAIVALVSQ